MRISRALQDMIESLDASNIDELKTKFSEALSSHDILPVHLKAYILNRGITDMPLSESYQKIIDFHLESLDDESLDALEKFAEERKDIFHLAKLQYHILENFLSVLPAPKREEVTQELSEEDTIKMMPILSNKKLMSGISKASKNCLLLKKELKLYNFSIPEIPGQKNLKDYFKNILELYGKFERMVDAGEIERY